MIVSCTFGDAFKLAAMCMLKLNVHKRVSNLGIAENILVDCNYMNSFFFWSEKKTFVFKKTQYGYFS